MKNEAKFRERYFDYSSDRVNAPTLTIMVGASGSGKSTIAKERVNRDNGKTVRFNRDSLRLMLYVDTPWNPKKEDLIRRYEEDGVRVALSMGLNVIVDDTNCTPRVRDTWEQIAKVSRAHYCITFMSTSKEECLRRNALREGRECIPVDAIENQFKHLREASVEPFGYGLTKLNQAVADLSALNAGTYAPRLPNAPWVIFDVDGTLAHNDGARSQYDETKVLLDSVREPVAAWVRSLYPTHNIAIFSGRHDICCSDTCLWLEEYKIPKDLILMRPGGSLVSDTIIKQNLLDTFLKLVPKTMIAFVVDDRPKVVRMWKDNGLKVYPVGGTTDHHTSCTFKPNKRGWKHCPDCGALEDF